MQRALPHLIEDLHQIIGEDCHRSMPREIQSLRVQPTSTGGRCRATRCRSCCRGTAGERSRGYPIVAAKLGMESEQCHVEHLTDVVLHSLVEHAGDSGEEVTAESSQSRGCMHALPQDQHQGGSIDAHAGAGPSARARWRSTWLSGPLGQHVRPQERGQPRDLLVQPRDERAVVLLEQCLVLRADVVDMRPQQVGGVFQRGDEAPAARPQYLNLLLLLVEEAAPVLDERASQLLLRVAVCPAQKSDDPHTGRQVDVGHELRDERNLQICALHGHLVLQLAEDRDLLSACLVGLQHVAAIREEL
mmetsp:Transcript_25399/g.72495  ORF Transcript_25399/g.72495 Transcript_25399/m.72495 type:complete len:303 (+) Transcript_25399:591-1499(+)